MGITANATAEGKFFARRRMLNVQRTLLAFQRRAFGSHRTLGQLRLGQMSHALEVVVAGVAKVSRTEAKEHGDRAAISTLVLEVIRAVFRAHLGPGDIAAAAAHKLFGVVVVAVFVVAGSFSTVIGLSTLVARVVGVTIECESGRVVVETASFRGHGLAFAQPFVFQSQKRFLSHVLLKGLDGL